MIGGRVLDTSALLAFARSTSIYATAAVWTAVEESIVLLVPSTAVAAAWTELADGHRPVLEVLLHLPVTVIDNLDEARARVVGQLAGSQVDARDRLRPRTRLASAHRPPRPVRPIQQAGVDFESLS